MGQYDKEFLLGIAVLLGWCIIIVLCASPQLFRNWLTRWVCCTRTDRKSNIIKIKEAQERVRTASQSFLATSMVAQPSQILLHQAMGGSGGARWTEPILEEKDEVRLEAVVVVKGPS